MPRGWGRGRTLVVAARRTRPGGSSSPWRSLKPPPATASSRSTSRPTPPTGCWRRSEPPPSLSHPCSAPTTASATSSSCEADRAKEFSRCGERERQRGKKTLQEKHAESSRKRRRPVASFVLLRPSASNYFFHPVERR